MSTPNPNENPYLVATFAPRPTAPFNGIGVLADTQASITHAQDAINTYGYNLDNERDRAQQRVIKDTNYPYAVQQTKRMGEAGVRNAQGEVMRAGNYALNQGLAVDQFDTLAGDLGVTRTKEYTDETGKVVPSRLLYGGIDAPTTANPTMTQAQKVAFNQRALNTPYEVGGDVNAQGQLTPLPGAAAAPAAVSPSTPYTGPLSNTPLNVPGIPSSVLGATRTPQQPRPMATHEERRAYDINQGIFRDRIKQLDLEIAAADAASPVSPYGLSRGLTDPRAENLRQQRADLIKEAAAMQSPGPDEPPIVGSTAAIYSILAGNGYPAATGQGILRNPPNAMGADPIPNAPADAVSFEPPPAMVKQAPALVQGFKNTAATYTQYAPGGPGGVEAALLINALESNFRPGVKAGSSTATGGAQFVGKTWLDGARKWDMPWAKGKTDEEILALRSSPPHMAQMERAMRMQNFSIATSDKYAGKFDPYNPLNLYAMHHFHPERGADLAASLRTRPNASVASVFGPKYWNTALAANPHLAPNGRSMTVAELYTFWINEGKKRGFFNGVQA